MQRQFEALGGETQLGLGMCALHRLPNARRHPFDECNVARGPDAWLPVVDEQTGTKSALPDQRHRYERAYLDCSPFSGIVQRV